MSGRREQVHGRSKFEVRALHSDSSAHLWGKVVMPLSAAARRAIAQAEAEGLMLLRSSKNATGFLCVHKLKPGQPKPYQAQLSRNGKQHVKQRSLGNFATAEEAALAVARFLGPEECAARSCCGSPPRTCSAGSTCTGSGGR